MAGFALQSLLVTFGIFGAVTAVLALVRASTFTSPGIGDLTCFTDGCSTVADVQPTPSSLAADQVEVNISGVLFSVYFKIIE